MKRHVKQDKYANVSQNSSGQIAVIPSCTPNDSLFGADPFLEKSTLTSFHALGVWFCLQFVDASAVLSLKPRRKKQVKMNLLRSSQHWNIRWNEVEFVKAKKSPNKDTTHKPYNSTATKP